VLQALVEAKKKGLFAAAVIKKRRYWPKHKPVGTVDALPGTLDNIPFHIFCMKEEDYTMMLMSTCGTIDEKCETHGIVGKGANEKKLTFKYTEVFENHYQGRHSVDDNNKQRMQPIALEETWQTDHWENRIFTFLLVLSAANAQ